MPHPHRKDGTWRKADFSNWPAVLIMEPCTPKSRAFDAIDRETVHVSRRGTTCDYHSRETFEEVFDRMPADVQDAFIIAWELKP